MNTFGHIFRLTSFGESHGPAMGGVIDGMPAGLEIDLKAIQKFVDRRRAAGRPGATSRHERDRVEVLSGIFEGRTLGTPIGFIVRNNDVRSEDYDALRDVYRPSHADFTYQQKYGIRDHRGGGRASARETVTRVVAGAFAIQALARLGVSITGYVSQIGDVEVDVDYVWSSNKSRAQRSKLSCPDRRAAILMGRAIERARREGETIGGAITCVARGVPPGWGEPVAAKLHADLSAAMMSINAAKAFEMGMGTQFPHYRGSLANDPIFADENGEVTVMGNFAGGVIGGISDGGDVWFKVTFKPVPTLPRPIHTVNVRGESVVVQPQGRHDICVVPRAVPIVEAMTALVLLDHYLLNKTTHL